MSILRTAISAIALTFIAVCNVMAEPTLEEKLQIL